MLAEGASAEQAAAAAFADTCNELTTDGFASRTGQQNNVRRRLQNKVQECPVPMSHVYNSKLTMIVSTGTQRMCSAQA